MALLDPRPKQNETDLFGRTEELVQLQRYIADKEPLIVISGLRRIGKTSLVKTTLNGLKYGIFVDAYKLGAKDSVKKEQILELFATAIQRFYSKHKTIREYAFNVLKSITSVNILGNGISVNPSQFTEANLTNLFDNLNDWAIENDEIIVLAIDEVQEFSKASDIDLAKIFSSFYNYENIVLILTGSQVGLLQDFVRKDDDTAPFYGRERISLQLMPLSEDKSKGFLLKAFQEKGIKINQTVPYDQILDEAAKELGGIVGWLVSFGRKCGKKITKQAIIETQKEGSIQVYGEFNKFVPKQFTEKYCQLMVKLANLSHFGFEQYVKKNNLQSCVNSLEIEGYVIKDIKKRYHATDPLLAYAFRETTSPVKKIPLKKKKKK